MRDVGYFTQTSLSIANWYADSEQQKQAFRNDADAYTQFRKAVEQQMNENFSASIKGSAAQHKARNVWSPSAMTSHSLLTFT
jgi:hypothetical protein